MATGKPPTSVSDVIRLVSRHGKKGLLVSGTEGFDKPPAGRVLIDVAGVSALNNITVKGAKVTFGTGLSFGQLLRELTGEGGVLRQAVSMLGSPLHRNRITVASALDPESAYFDLTTALLILDARIQIQTERSRKMVGIREFLDLVTKGLKKGEMPTAVEFSRIAESEKAGFFRVARVGKKGTVSAAARLKLKRSFCSAAEIVVSGSTLIPLRVKLAEAEVSNQTIADNTVPRVAARAADEILELMGSDDSYERTLIEITVGRTLRGILEGNTSI